MIAFVTGPLVQKGPDWVIVKVAGFGIRLYVPTSTVDRIGAPGDVVYLQSHLSVKENDLSLYGFDTKEALSLFMSLIGVAGIGPRLALSILSALAPEVAAEAILSGNANTLLRVPGVGKKMADRITLELRGKLDMEWGQMAIAQDNRDSPVVAALLNLGYSSDEARKALASLDNKWDLSTEEQLRAVLQFLGKSI